jgi:hypothetical protein
MDLRLAERGELHLRRRGIRVAAHPQDDPQREAV